ncbi:MULTISPECIES: hypothetical protein [Cyanophyceae]|uniref:Uncharacterized protein n=1 Tax=Leptolyngbya subtilissima DQ-A4 TaxID=2933933 RepID=A0ABV0K2X6_9CYAN|nr:hypothetical protein [Nodosilinea sp. FACHB-141]
MLTVSPERIQLPPGSTVTLHYQTWDDYETLLTSRRDDAAIKIRFNVHTQQISLMAPMAGHGNNPRKSPLLCLKTRGLEVAMQGL